MKTVYNDPGLAYLEHDGVIRETDKAKLFKIGDEEVWIPKSQIEDEGDEVVAIPTWLSEAKGLRSDW
jgi:hypothetical protein